MFGEWCAYHYEMLNYAWDHGCRVACMYSAHTNVTDKTDHDVVFSLLRCPQRTGVCKKSTATA